MAVKTPPQPTTLQRRVRRVGKRVLTTAQLLTSSARLLPDFMIIGVQRGGTTTLFQWLAQHPQVRLPRKKEIHYFDFQYYRPLAWYRSHFPIALREESGPPLRRGFLTGEASPYYLFHPAVPSRVANLLPRVKLIALLRNPVDRAYSQYQHEVDHGNEPLSFTDAIASEEERLAGEEQKLFDPHYHSFNHQHFSYVARGHYLDQLQRWRQYYPADQMLVLRSEDLYTEPAQTMARVTQFLGLDEWNWDEFRRHNALAYEPMDPITRASLQRHFAPHNERLGQYLNLDLAWDVVDRPNASRLAASIETADRQMLTGAVVPSAG